MSVVVLAGVILHFGVSAFMGKSTKIGNVKGFFFLLVYRLFFI